MFEIDLHSLWTIFIYFLEEPSSEKKNKKRKHGAVEEAVPVEDTGESSVIASINQSTLDERCLFSIFFKIG